MDSDKTDQQKDGTQQLGHVPHPGERLTTAVVQDVIDRLLENGLIFRLDNEALARHLAQRFLGRGAWRSSLEDIRDLIADRYGIPDDVPSNIQEFLEWVRKELFSFDILPSRALAEIYNWASEDFQAIEKNIDNCQRAIQEVERRSPKTDADPSDKRFYSYYLKLNRAAKDEIVGVLTHSVHKKALRNSYRAGRIFKALVYYSVWSFRLNPAMFDPDAFSPVRHIFLDLPIRDLRELERLYTLLDKTPFDQYLHKYVSDTKPIEKIRRLIDQHHLLAARKSVLKPLLDAYERNEFPLFMSAAATQIEGIIEDACMISGISLDSLRLGSIVTKLEKLVKDTRVGIDYVYYAFKYPVVRNRIAHGRVLPTDMRDIHLLLLDLYDCCNLVANHPGTANALVKLLKRAKPDTVTLADVVEFAVIYVQTNGKRPDDFYDLAREFEDFTPLLDMQVIWDFMKELHGSHLEELDNGLHFIAEWVRKKVSTLRTQGTQMLAILGDRGFGEFNKERFMDAVRSQPRHSELVIDLLRGLLIDVLRARVQFLQTSTPVTRK